MTSGLNFVLTAETGGFEAAIHGASSAVQREISKMNLSAQSLDRAIGKGFKSAAASAQVFERAMNEGADEIQRLEATLDPVARNLQAFARAQQLVNNAVRDGIITQERANAIMTRAEQRWATWTRLLGRSGFGGAIQSAGYQVGDFAVQLASGQNPMVAFTQQGTQLISMFGPWGAVIGAAGAVVGALAMSFLDLGEEAKTTHDLVDELGGAISDLRASTITGGEGIADLIEKYGALDATLITLIQRQRQLNLEIAQSGLRDAIRSVSDNANSQFDSVFNLTSAQPFNDPSRQGGFDIAVVQDLKSEFDISGGAAFSLAEALNALSTASTPDAQVDAVKGLGDALAKAKAESDNPALRTLAKDVNDVALRIKEMEEAERKAGESMQVLSQPLGELNRLADEATSKTRSGAKATNEKADALQQLIGKTDESIAKMQEEAAAAGLDQAAQDDLRLAYELQRLEAELLIAAKKSNNDVTAEEAARIREVIDLYREVGQALNQKKAAAKEHEAAQRRAAKAEQDFEKATENTVQGVLSVAEAFRDAARGAQSWEDAILRLIDVLIQLDQQGALMNLATGGTQGGSIIPGLVGGALDLFGFGGSTATNSGNMFGSAGALFDAGGGLIESALIPHFATGGSMTLGGAPGVDRNTLSLNGQPIAKVSRGEQMTISAQAGGGMSLTQNIYAQDGPSVVRSKAAIAASGRRAFRKMQGRG